MSTDPWDDAADERSKTVLGLFDAQTAHWKLVNPHTIAAIRLSLSAAARYRDAEHDERLAAMVEKLFGRDPAYVTRLNGELTRLLRSAGAETPDWRLAVREEVPEKFWGEDAHMHKSSRGMTGHTHEGGRNPHAHPEAGDAGTPEMVNRVWQDEART